MAALFNFKSSEVGTLKTPGLQRSSVQPTRAISESKSNVNISFFALRNIFIWLWARVAVVSAAEPSGYSDIQPWSVE